LRAGLERGVLAPLADELLVSRDAETGRAVDVDRDASGALSFTWGAR
jgi:hypothetical protein